MSQRNQVEAGVNNAIIVSIVAYLTIMGWLIAVLFLNKSKYPLADFHIRQALGINLLSIVCSIVIIVPVLGWIAGAVGYLLVVVMWIVGIIHAIKGEEKEVPILGAKFQEWFQGL